MFSFCGQFDLALDPLTPARVELNPLVQRFRSLPGYAEYYEVQHLIRETGTTVFYFHGRAPHDLAQRRLVDAIPSIKPFAMRMRMHGVPVLKQDLALLLSASDDELHALHTRYAGRCMSRLVFSTWAFGSRHAAAAVAELLVTRSGAAVQRITRLFDRDTSR